MVSQCGFIDVATRIFLVTSHSFSSAKTECISRDGNSMVDDKSMELWCLLIQVDALNSTSFSTIFLFHLLGKFCCIFLMPHITFLS